MKAMDMNGCNGAALNEIFRFECSGQILILSPQECQHNATIAHQQEQDQIKGCSYVCQINYEPHMKTV